MDPASQPVRPEPASVRYQRDGYLVVPSLLPAAECDALKEEARALLARHARPGASVHVHCAAVNERFAALAADARVIGILRGLMPEGVMFLSDKIVYKAADRRFATPWHIDAFYWRGTRPKLSVWIPLDDASAGNGTLTVVPGSHRQEWRMVRRGLPNGEFGDEVDGANWNRSQVVTCEIRRGTAVVFSDRLVHGSTENTAGRDRYAIISTYHAPAPDEPFDLDFPARRVLVPAP